MAGSPTTSKAIDFAGGTAVHINAGVAGLALAIILGKRIGWKRDPMRPHNLTLVMLGAGLLWFGWFGFNAGSAVAAGNTASVVWVNTMVATGAACLGWLLTERIRDGHATSLGAASGIVAGLVAITPSCSSVSPVGAIIVGALAGVICALAVGLKYKFGYDDSLDVVGVHLVGGLWGTLAVGFLATAAAPAGVNGLFYGGGFDQLWRQAVGAFAVLFFSLILTLLIGCCCTRPSASGSAKRKSSRASTSPSTLRPATISARSVREHAACPTPARRQVRSRQTASNDQEVSA